MNHRTNRLIILHKMFAIFALDKKALFLDIKSVLKLTVSSESDEWRSAIKGQRL